MNEEHQRSAGQITPMETAAIGNLGEGQPNASALEAPAISTEIQGHTQTLGPGSKSPRVDQAGTILPETSPAHEIRAPIRDTIAMPEPRGSRARRVGLVAGALVTALGLGWIGGSNSYRLVDLSPVWTGLQQKLNSSVRSVASVWNETVGGIAVTAGTTGPGKMAGQDATSEPPNTREVSSRKANDVDDRLVDGGESSQGAARDLTIRVEQLREVTERSQREILAGVGRLAERLERVEAQLANLSAIKSTPSAAQQNSGSARPALAGQRPTPGAAAKISSRLPATEAYPDRRQNAIEGWTIREVFGGTAVLAGPDGIRKVSPGDTVPGVGRIESIVRWGKRWVVTTSRGMITMDQAAP
jgi:hypothetical protein